MTMLVRPDMTPAEELAWLQEQMAHKVKRKPRTSKMPPERAAQQSVVTWIKQVLPDAVVQHVKNESAPKSLTPQQRMNYHAKRKKDGLTWGFPDLIVLLPAGRVLLIEMKKPDIGKGKGVVSDTQSELHGKLTAMGHMVGVATCQDTARYLLHLWGIPTREAAGAPMREARVRTQKRQGDPLDDMVPF